MAQSLAIALVMTLLGGALFLLKKRGAATFRLPRLSAAAREMEVIERVALGPHHALHLVRIGDRRVLVATAPSSCQVVSQGGEEL
jgi:flagellar biogenesis protein FliO